jgi:hypothetical protein
MPNDIFIRHGKKFYIAGTGMCCYEKIRFVWLNHRTFYKLTRDVELLGFIGDKVVPRKEYFSGILMSAYIGWRNCFMEFFDALAGCKNFPTEDQFKEASKKLHLNKKVTRIYIQNYKNFFGKRRRKK